jgi:integrase
VRRIIFVRSGYASILIKQKENIKYISTQLGHSTPMVTLNVYAHLMEKTNPEAALRLEEAILSGPK